MVVLPAASNPSIRMRVGEGVLQHSIARRRWLLHASIRLRRQSLNLVRMPARCVVASTTLSWVTGFGELGNVNNLSRVADFGELAILDAAVTSLEMSATAPSAGPTAKPTLSIVVVRVCGCVCSVCARGCVKMTQAPDLFIHSEHWRVHTSTKWDRVVVHGKGSQHGTQKDAGQARQGPW